MGGGIAPFDAAVLILDGTTEIIIGGESFVIYEDKFVIMPADIPHTVKAKDKFKIILTR